MANIAPSVITALVGLVGVIFGTLIGHYFNHQLNLRNSKKDILFKKKLEYFEKLAGTIEMNIKVYKNSLNAIKSAKTKRETKKLILEMKENRKNFKIMASPLYFNIKSLSERIVYFVNIEKDIFNMFEEIKMNEKIREDKLLVLEEKVDNLRNCANSILNEMKAELKK